MSGCQRLGDALHARLLLAILGAGAGLDSAGCHNEPPTTAATNNAPATAAATTIDATPSTPMPSTLSTPMPSTLSTPTPSTPSTPTPSTPSTPTPTPSTPTPSVATPSPRATKVCGNPNATEQCFAPFTSPRSQGTGEPASAPPPSAYNKDGCLPKSQVTNGCCNPAADGPHIKNGQCCYSFCPGPCCGRPFLVGGIPHVAPLAEREDWLARDLELRLDPVRLDARTVRALRDAWLLDARMEHASAAAFGRFVLQLLALGAPSHLVRDAALDAADEVRHAELCFALATRFDEPGASAYGPMPLALDGALDARTLAEVIAEVIAEGCVGETIAALVASRQLEGASDPAARQVLEQIAVDEAKHAEHAWSFVRWALIVGGDTARASATKAFERALRSAEPIACAEGRVDPSTWRMFGRLSATELADTTRYALAEIIAPCARALLESVATNFAGEGGSDYRMAESSAHSLA